MFTTNTANLLRRPTVSLPSGFNALSDTAKNLPSLIHSGASVLRHEVRKIPLLDTKNLSGGEVRLAILYYHILQSAYVHVEEGESVIPKNIAIPAYRLSVKLSGGDHSSPSIIRYFSYVNDNWKEKYPDAPFSLENIEPLATFTGTKSEKMFILTHLTPFEHLGADGKQVILRMCEAVKTHQNTLLIKSLETLTLFLREMQIGFSQIEKYVSPDVYRNTIRRYLMSLNNVVYDGVEEYGGIPQSFTGASGMQTTTIPNFSLALGIRYKNEKIREPIAKIKQYLHPRDQVFMCFVEDSPNVWEYIKKYHRNNLNLIRAYNDCLKALEDFRVSHGKFIASYITPSKPDEHGTGNTVIPWWLNAIIEEIKTYYL
jgi:hypothetical protein